MYSLVLSTLAAALKRSRLPYMVIGGQAVVLYGEPRMTKDIDITVGVGVDEFARVAECMKGAGCRSLVKNGKAFARKTFVWPIEHARSGVRIDVIFSETRYERQAMRRCIKVRVGGRIVLFASPEDVIIHKIISGRPRDLEDVRSIFAGGEKMDVRYMRMWLEEFGEVLNRPLRRTLESLKPRLRTTIKSRHHGKS